MQYDENAEKYGYDGEMTPMKCDELKEVMNVMQVSGEHIPSGYYKKSEVDEAIAELKEFAENVCLERDDNQTAIDELQAENAELKQTIDKLVGVKKSAEQILQNLLDCGLIKEWYFNGKFNAVLKAADPHLQIAELKQKLENVQASMYADVVDANMENRRLRRALYKACANWAHFAVIFFSPYAIKEKWYTMELKCRAKAEEYK